MKRHSRGENGRGKRNRQDEKKIDKWGTAQKSCPYQLQRPESPASPAASARVNAAPASRSFGVGEGNLDEGTCGVHEAADGRPLKAGDGTKPTVGGWWTASGLQWVPPQQKGHESNVSPQSIAHVPPNALRDILHAFLLFPSSPKRTAIDSLPAAPLHQSSYRLPQTAPK